MAWAIRGCRSRTRGNPPSTDDQAFGLKSPCWFSRSLWLCVNMRGKFVRVRVAVGVVIALALAGAAWRYGVAGRGDVAAAPAPASVVRFGPESHRGLSRIVALSPGIAIMLRDMGRGDAIVGRHAFDMVLPKNVPVCGDQQGLDYEALLAAKPTDVLMQWGAREWPPRLRELAQEHGWSVADYRLLSLDDVVEAEDDLARHYGGPNAIDEVDRMRAAWKPTPGRFAGAGRVLILESVDPPAALGPGSFHQQILERIGGTPAIVRGKAYMVLDVETVLDLKPDGIIVFSPRVVGSEAGTPMTAEQVRAKLGRIGTLDIPAVKNGKLAVIDDPLGLTPSTALIGVTEEMGRVLGGWAGEEREKVQSTNRK